MAAIILLAGCDADEELRANAARDSAGIRIIVSAAPSWSAADAWRVDPSPALEIGVAEGAPEYQLYRVGDAERLADGRTLIANSGTQQIRIYGADGRHIISAGGQGEGPGEFAEFSAMRICTFGDDSLIVDDGGNGRQNVYAGEQFVRTFRPEPPAGERRAFNVGCFDDGSLLTITAAGGGILRGDPGTVIRTTWETYRHATDGRALQRLASYEDRPRFVNQVGDIIHYPFVPLHAQPAAVAAGEHAYFGDGAEPEIRRVNRDGTVDALIRWAPAQRASTSEVWERYRSVSLEDMNDESRVRYRRLYEQDLPLPERVPAYQSIKVDAEGNVWAERYRLPWDSVPVWEVFDTDGAWLGTVETPADLRVLRIYRDAILGRHMDELGVERVRLHRLIRP